MNRRISYLLLLLAAAALISGCAMRTVEQMYCLPKRSAEYQELQNAIDSAVPDLEYCAPLSGEHQQSVQSVDLDGDGADEYLVFTRDTSEKPLRILVFGTDEDGYLLRDTIESSGSDFELVEYADIDGKPGLELVVGRQVSDQLLRSLSVYSFEQGTAAQLMTAKYSRYVTCDLDSDGLTELLVISPGSSDAECGVAVLYDFSDGQMTRSTEVKLSAPSDDIKRITVSNLQDGVPAVYVAGSVDGSAIITDVFAMYNGRFSNVSLANASGTSVQTLRNYYIYAEDIDGDGILELPSLMTMDLSSEFSDDRQYLIRWFSMDLNGAETDKMFTFHDLTNGWYLQLDESWVWRVSVIQEGSTYVFHLWDEAHSKTEKIMTVYVLTGAERETVATEDGRFLLFWGDEVVYAALLEEEAAACGIDQETLTNSFHLIYKDWTNGETE